MKKKNILFVLFIIFGIPFLFLVLLVGGGIWLYTAVSEPAKPIVKVVKPEPDKVRIPENSYNIEALNFADFTDHLSLEKNTSMHVSYFWDNAKGKRVTWTGEVFDVKGGRGKAEILIANSEKPVVKGYNIVLVSYKPAQAAALKKGEYVTFSGEVFDNKRDGKSLIIYLDNADILH